VSRVDLGPEGERHPGRPAGREQALGKVPGPEDLGYGAQLRRLALVPVSQC
jgi:hypothetical protein